MSTFEKEKQKLLSVPKDYTYPEAVSLLKHLGFTEFTKGKTSGSRMKFFRESDKRIILLHKPHPGNIMAPGAVFELKKNLISMGEL